MFIRKSCLGNLRNINYGKKNDLVVVSFVFYETKHPIFFQILGKQS